METLHISNAGESPLSSNVKTIPAIIILAVYVVIYVLPLYLFSSTRPSSTQNRDMIPVIRARVASVIRSCCACSILTWLIIFAHSNGSAITSLHLMGYFPVGFTETLKALLLTAILYIGPLFEEVYVESEWRNWIYPNNIRMRSIRWIAWRNYVVGPITEEMLFRSASIPILLLSKTSSSRIILLTPLVFGIAHFHHLYEFSLTHPNAPLRNALLQSLLQLCYTTAFGAYATFIFLRTGSLLSVILVHAFCNWMGLPRLWGLVGESNHLIGANSFNIRHANRPAVWYSTIYYSLLVAGAWSWWTLLLPLTFSKNHIGIF